MTHCVNALADADLSCGEGCALALAMLVALGIYLLVSKAVNKSGLCSLEDGSFIQGIGDADFKRRLDAVAKKNEEHQEAVQEQFQNGIKVVSRDPRTGRPTKVIVRVPVEREIRIDYSGGKK